MRVCCLFGWGEEEFVVVVAGFYGLWAWWDLWVERLGLGLG